MLPVYRKSIGLALALLLPVSGAVFAADALDAVRDVAREAADAAVRDIARGAAVESARIDNALREKADQLTDGLAQSNNQYQEAQRLGQSPVIANRYGSPSAIDQTIRNRADEANALLSRARERDDYTMQRRELLNNQSIYAPGTSRHEEFNAKIRELDRRFADRPFMDRNEATHHLSRIP